MFKTNLDQKPSFDPSPDFLFRYEAGERMPVTVRTGSGVAYIGYLSADRMYVEAFETGLCLWKIRKDDSITQGVSREYLSYLNSR